MRIKLTILRKFEKLQPVREIGNSAVRSSWAQSKYKLVY